jgi:hypothetical protein
MNEHEFSPTEKIKMAEEFLDTPFWRRVFEPYLKAKIQEIMVSFVNCKKDDLEKYQGSLLAYNNIDDFTQDYIEAANVQIEMDREAEKVEEGRQYSPLDQTTIPSIEIWD